MKKLLLPLLCAIILTSCSEDYSKLQNDSSKESLTVNNRISSTEDYYNFLNPQTDDFIMIEDLRNLDGDVIEKNIYSQSRNSQPIGLLYDGSSLTGDIQQATDLNYWNGTFDAKKIFTGSYVSSKLDKGTLELVTANENENSTYVPKILEVKITNLDSEGNVKPGTIISWERDENNDNGVLAGLEYNPESQTNANIAEANRDSNRRFSTIDDNGSYEITSADLNHFPENANLTFYVGRISKIVKVSDDTKRSLSVNFYTAVKADFGTKR
jgi:hypothetical protein